MRAALEAALQAQLNRTLHETDLSALGTKYRGKVRDCYSRGGQRILVVTDRLSAFDVVLGTIPFKGQVLNQTAQYWFEKTAHLVPNHVIAVPDANATVAHDCEPLNVEFVMRAYLTGSTSTSIWKAYERGARTFCGYELPGGMRRHEKLPRAILTPSTKAEQGAHDVSASREDILAMGVISAADFDAAAALVATLFAFGQEMAESRGLILADTKYELGRKSDGTLVFIDEIHTPDSSRYWFATDYQDRMKQGLEPRGLDKEYVRRWLVDERGYSGEGPPPPLSDDVRLEAARRYISTYELLTGQAFLPDTEEPHARLARNLRPYGATP